MVVYPRRFFIYRITATMEDIMGLTQERGLFIVLEGGEGAGKSTAVKYIKEYLVGLEFAVTCTFSPGAGFPDIRKKLQDPNVPLTPEGQLELFLQDRRALVENIIMPALTRGEIVVCDRFEPSTFAYQGCGYGLDIDMIREESKKARLGVEPDLVLLFDVRPRIGLKRAKGDTRFEQETLAFHERVYRGFCDQAKKDPRRWRVIDASRPLEDVRAQIIGALKLFLVEKGWIHKAGK